MPENILNTLQGAAFFVDLQTVIEDEVNKESKENDIKKNHKGGTALFIPLYGKSSEKNIKHDITAEDLHATFTKEQLYDVHAFDNTNSKHLTHANPLSRSCSYSTINTKPKSLKPAKISNESINLPIQRFAKFEESHRELKEFITECDRIEKDHLECGWSNTYNRLPKLPKWVTDKQMSLDSNIALLTPGEGLNQKTMTIDKHEVQIEELFSNYNINEKIAIQNHLPPIVHKEPTKVKRKNRTSENPTCRNKKKSANKPTIKVKGDTKSSVRKKMKKKRVPKKGGEEKEKEQITIPCNKSLPKDNAILENDDIFEMLENIDPVISEQSHEETENNIDDEFSVVDSLEIFYDKVLKAETINKTEEIGKEMKIRLVNNISGSLKIHANSLKCVNNVAESMEKTLSLDDKKVFLTRLSSPPEKREISQTLHDLKCFHVRPDLSKISEEKTLVSTVSKRSFVSRGISSHSESNSESINEITKLVFQPGIISDSDSLASISIKNSTISSESSNDSDRPYLRSVLGYVSARSVYTSSSCDSNQEISNNVLEWQKGKVIDRGAFGIVYQGLTNTGQMIAIKEVNISHSKNMDKNFRKLQDEINILKNLKHPNIIRFIGTSLDEDIVYIFMEYIAGGSLAALIQSFGCLNECIYRRYTKQIVSGVSYIHKCGVIHRDIKGANILISVKGIIKLIDFGCAKELSISLGSTILLKSVKGTPYWMSPETVKGTGCNHKSDIWSIGCTVMEMATGKPPWSEYPPYAAMYAVADEGNTPPSLIDKHSAEARDFVDKCLRRNMMERPSAEELTLHPFVLTA